MATDLELLDAWRGGDQVAAKELFERHFDGLCWFFRNKVNEGVEDLVQATFLACIEARPNLRDNSSFRGLLFSIARRKLVDEIRKAQRGRHKADVETMAVDSLVGRPSAILTKKQEQKLLVHALRRIPLQHQMLLELYYWENLSGPELAKVLEIPEGTIRTRLRRGRTLLAEALESLEASPEAVQSTLTNLDDWARSVRPGAATE